MCCDRALERQAVHCVGCEAGCLWERSAQAVRQSQVGEAETYLQESLEIAHLLEHPSDWRMYYRT